MRIKFAHLRSIFITLTDLLVINGVFLLLPFLSPTPILFHDFYLKFWWLINIVYATFSLLVFKTSRSLWAFFSIKELIKLFTSLACFSIVVLSLFLFMYPLHNEVTLFYLNVVLFCFFLICLLIPRFLARSLAFLTHPGKDDKDCIPDNCKKRTLIVGAGQAGNKILREIQDYPKNKYKVIGFIDDDPLKNRSIISNIPVLGTSDDLNTIIKKHNIQTLIFAIPSIKSNLRRKMVIGLADTKVDMITVPGIYELLNEDINISALRRIRIEDLLPRKQIQTDLSKVEAILTGKTVLLTGAGGSIGSELARQIARFKPKELVLFERCENNLFYIDQELQNERKHKNIIPYIADMRNAKRVNEIFAKHKPDVVFHAAAYKHVPLMELNPEEAYTNNVDGSRNLLEASVKHNVKTFVNISTDKAVNPTNVMGQTKADIEKIVSDYDKKYPLVATSVRFGNVLGSEGSVLKVFKRQIEEEGVIRITDPQMKRYFMLIPEAVELVLQAASLANGNDIFFLKMGNQVPIIELARAYTRLKGFELEKDISLEIIGNRGNEKIEEELWDATETPIPTDNPFIFRIADCHCKK